MKWKFSAMEITRLRRPEGKVLSNWAFVGAISLAKKNPTSQTFAEWLYLHFYCCFLYVNPFFAPTIHSISSSMKSKCMEFLDIEKNTGRS